MLVVPGGGPRRTPEGLFTALHEWFGLKNDLEDENCRKWACSCGFQKRRMRLGGCAAYRREAMSMGADAGFSESQSEFRGHSKSNRLTPAPIIQCRKTNFLQLILARAAGSFLGRCFLRILRRPQWLRGHFLHVSYPRAFVCPGGRKAYSCAILGACHPDVIMETGARPYPDLCEHLCIHVVVLLLQRQLDSG